ncbi:hypothetical protein SARC_01395 [Sphaeroforma arctica JP610]|uniref:Non-canonical E2 ubiquitin-conjugating enzyme C-terminal domain-containing protein n=1 Tax=Sphaeroforma arctica JP610 TaxID=667725 RepID=A0A0L0GC05_9EUKA|nr:hypothetical protein SARC_01395 [Sphaeroforma arctica JP610]KNC86439.1 hypothetical protein SARC_01395 [Sphaeroforma arctica JP610]|eukprot:XP_014160341.1 hypothetical protein SARC_01395 [Sphaeroforma arctica JP610]
MPWIVTMMDGKNEEAVAHQAHLDKLTRLLDKEELGEDDEIENEMSETEVETNSPEEAGECPPGMCIECTDQPASRSCVECQDDFCEVCVDSIHRSGTRKRHKINAIMGVEVGQPQLCDNGNKADTNNPVELDSVELELENGNKVLGGIEEAKVHRTEAHQGLGEWFVERSKSIPLRLTFEERKYLRLVEAALNVSEYTEKVDICYFRSRAKRIVEQVRDICAILSGLLVSCDYKAGQTLVKDREFSENADFFQTVFEIGRRYKVLNPERMRSSYGKLLYFLQDTQIPEIKELLEFSCVKPMKTVYGYLEANGLLNLLHDDLLETATHEIPAHGQSRRDVQRMIKEKNMAVKRIIRRYADPANGIKEDDIERCLVSIGDNNSFLSYNRDPCDELIGYLRHYFSRSSIDPAFSLAIASGKQGARLTHSHTRQYDYVLQSLSLWREILHDFFNLWRLAEADLLRENNGYRLVDTGQGLNRIQSCNNTSRLMHAILNKAQRKVDSWVGSSVIHMGDHNVPNAFMFIDKYTQVARILNPIVICLRKLDSLENDPGLAEYIKTTFTSVDNCKRVILNDFFKFAFDGSGADNFFDAGSCIDGRLTSAWNWCSRLEKKRYYPVFLLTGFVGFDGEF